MTVNVPLEVGSASTTVEVSVEQAQLQTENANISTNFETKQIQEIPNPGGDVTYIAQTAPGVTMSNSAGGGFGNFSTFGLPGTSNLFTINGNDYNDPFLNLNNTGSSNLLLGGNELQEISVVNNAYTGEYGRQAGSQIDYTTKSGSNSFHGNAVYNWTGRYLNANDPLLNAAGQPRPFENNNQWAASLGGPVIKDKLFFFVNTEGIRYIFGAVKSVTTPTLAFENYTLGNIAGKGAPTIAFYQNAFKLWNAAPGIRAAVPNPQSCSGNGLPATGLLASDVVHPVLDGQFPPRAIKSGCSRPESIIPSATTTKYSAACSLIAAPSRPTRTSLAPTFDTFSTQPQNEGQLNYTHVFNPTVVNNFIGSVLQGTRRFSAPSPPRLPRWP